MSLDDEARYACPTCGEEIVVPIDRQAGSNQSYVEDCPVCCSPIVLRVQIEDDGEITIQAEPE
jgi:DNA-directed RNA polymerase subunit RPC12/RpoP